MPSRSIRTELAVLVLATAFGAPPRAAAQAQGQALSAGTAEPSPAASVSLDETLVAVEVNRQREREAVLILRDAAGTIFVSEATLARWRMHRPSAGGTLHEGERFFALGALGGVRANFDQARQTLEVHAEPAAFERTRLDSDRRLRTTITQSPPGVFVNYDLSFVKPNGDQGTGAGLTEIGVFARAGVVTSTALAQTSALGTHNVRLESAYVRDWVDSMQTLRLGDSVSRGGTWGRPVRFGGLQFGTNFAVQPGFIRAPTLAAVGQAALPSVVDVFVNNTFVTRRDVPPGPFSVGNIPPIAGPGTVNLVVTDILGRQQVISQSFYASPALLGRGISDYSVEAGMLRHRFAQTSNEYGEGLAVGTWRHGLTDQLTVEGHAEAAARARVAGGGVDYLARDIGTVFSGHLAASSSGEGEGALGVLGADYQGRRVRIGARTQWTSPQFRQVGIAPSDLPLARLTTLSGGLNLGTYGSLGLAVARQARRDGTADSDVYTLSYTYQLGKLGFLNLSLTRLNAATDSTSVFALFAVPLEKNTNANISASRSHNGDGTRSGDVTLGVQRALGAGEGWGYRGLARSSGEVQAGASYAYSAGVVSADATTLDGNEAVRIGVTGGVGLIDKQLFASRQITESFALVHVPGFADVRVLRDNQLEGRTDSRGYAVLPRLRAYDRNRITLDARDLPLDARIESLRLEVAPPFRSGVVVPFPVRRERAGSVRILLDDGGPVPAGAVVRLNGGSEPLPVALRGEAFLAGLQAGDTNSIEVEWRGARCAIALPGAPADEPLADFGEVRCSGVVR